MVISGGGTGGHLFPAIAIAQKVKLLSPKSEVLFVGAEGKMEMEKVPKYNFPIEGLWISGFNRQQMAKNITLPFKVVSSLLKAMGIVRRFKPDIAVGVGGYASGPLLWAAGRKGIPTLLQEQNSFPGVTNKLLAPKAKKICVAFKDMDKYFEKDKLVLTGNPIRENIQKIDPKEARRTLGFDPDKKTVLVIGGSLGARTLNEAIKNNLEQLLDSGVQLLWQTGKLYYDSIMSEVGSKLNERIKPTAFIDSMDTAYAAADLVISRAGALSISELTYLGKASILVPSPNVAEDHQTKNAMALVNSGAALLVTDAEAKEKLVDKTLQLLETPEKLSALARESEAMAMPDAATLIAHELFKLVG